MNVAGVEPPRMKRYGPGDVLPAFHLAPDLPTFDPWRDDAACLSPSPPGYDPWFPVPASATKEALYVCRLCPVQKRCLDEALAEERDAGRLRYGVRGGMTPEQRELMTVRQF